MKKKTKAVKKTDGKLREYEFTVYMIARGTSPEEAWVHAAEYAMQEADDFLSTKNLPEFKVIDVVEDY